MMLILKDLTKTYKPKKGVSVQALNGISLSFDEKGLVFVLGRSGSGKSTLLNVVGGLDSYDGGEIIIDGKSSKDFKAADYDTYRNTYIGFIFQDYNLLDDLTVGENIMLALELQNQKADKERLESILKEVELEGFADRKPNELSGGQRQRVAIARALVKDPQIIMADEPTGALDEETGIQVLNTLKKMSEDKLVIVVSHDREFAEQYADRIIRLADGKVKSDTSKNAESTNFTVDEKAEKIKSSHLPYHYALKMGASGVWTKPFRLIITVIMCMVSFSAFGAVDTVNAFNAAKVSFTAYLDSDFEVSAYTAQMVSPYSKEMEDTNGASEKDIERLKQKTGLDYTGVAYIDYQNKNGYNLFLISSENLDGKNNSPYYTQTLYGYYPASEDFFDAMKFDLTGHLPKAGNEIVITQYLFEQINLGGINLYAEINDSVGNKYETVVMLPDLTRTEQSVIEKNLYMRLGNEYWKIVGIVDTHEDKNGKFKSLKPSQEYNYNRQELLEEECINYFRYGYHSIGYISQEKYEDIVKSHSMDMEGFDFFGIEAKGNVSITRGNNDINSRFLRISQDKDLDKVKDVIWIDRKERTELEYNEFVVGLNTAMNLLENEKIIESNTYYTHDKTYFDNIISFDIMGFDSLLNQEARYIACFEEAERIAVDKLSLFKDFICENIDLFPSSDKLYDKEINGVSYILRRLYSETYVFSDAVQVKEDLLEFDINKLKENHWRMLYAGYLLRKWDWKENFSVDDTLTNTVSWGMKCGYLSNVTGGRTGDSLENIDAKVFYITQKLQILSEQNVFDTAVSYRCNDLGRNYINIKDSKIVGIYVPQDDFYENKYDDVYVFNNKMYQDMSSIELEPYSFLLAPMPKDRTQIEKLVNVHFEENNRVLKMHNGVVVALGIVQRPIDQMSGLILIIGLALAVFSIMMLGNYIATSISNKKRDIGILRALGAKASDVFAIFVNESIIIAMVNTVLSIITSIFLCGGLNKMIKNMTQVSFTTLNFGIRQIAIMIIINIAIAVLASLIPIYRMSKKKPIDCIRDR